MIAKTALAAGRPWVLGGWLVLTAWITAASYRGESNLPAFGVWIAITALIHVTSRSRRHATPRRWLAASALAASMMLVITLLLAPDIGLIERSGLTLGGGLVPVSLLPLVGRVARRNRLGAWGAGIAHLGVALALIGVASASAFTSDIRVVTRPGERTEIGPWLIELTAVNPVAGEDFTAIQAELRATRGAGVSVLRAQARTAISPVAERHVPAVATAWNGRLSTGIGEPRGDGWELILAWAPFVTLQWLGGGLMVVGGLIALAGPRRIWLALAATVLMIGAVGFELSGRPGLAGSQRANVAPPPSKSLVTARNAFLGEFSGRSHWLIISDSYAARGQTRDAVGILQAATRQHPGDYALWLGLGNALTDHGRGLNPAARLAFARSAIFAPTSSAPAYFLGLAKLRSGDPEGALADWKKILADAPANASWRPFVEDSVAMVEGARPPR